MLTRTLALAIALVVALAPAAELEIVSDHGA